MDRAYSLLEIKAVDDEARVIEGIASTPSTDRMGDIVEPLGAEYTLPIPFLWQHESRESPIGNVVAAKPTKDGIPVRIQIESDDMPGPLKDRLDYAWRSIKKGLVRGLSIGFAPIGDPEPIKGTYGFRFPKWEWLELSAVTIPANAEASISLVKSIDAELRAATGQEQPGEPVQKKPGASGKPVKIIPRNAPPRGAMNIAEQIQNFEHTRASKAARRQEIQEKAVAEGRSKDDAEREEFDTLTEEIASVDAELKDLRVLEREAAASAKPVVATDTKAAGDSRNPRVVVKPEEKLEPGIEFARFAMCLAAAKGDVAKALNLAKTHYPQQVRAINVLKSVADSGSDFAPYAERFITSKADVSAGTTSDATWASPLVEYNQFAGDFVEYLRPQTIIGKFGNSGIPALRQIPFNVHIRGQTSGGTGYWVGEAKPKPVTAFDFNDTYHDFFKVAAIAVLTDELIRFSNPSAERLVRDALGGAVIERIDTTFIDPTVAAVANVSPASITNGVTAITSSGDDADAVRADVGALWAAAMAANLPMTSAVYITTPSIALHLSLMTNALGQSEFGGMSMMGGTLLGVPVIVSNHVPAGTFVLAFASEIWLSDDGGVTVDASREASIQMLDNPTNDSDTPTPTTLVSMFQTNSVALRAERFINWSKRRTTAVALLESVGWGGAAES